MVLLRSVRACAWAFCLPSIAWRAPARRSSGRVLMSAAPTLELVPCDAVTTVETEVKKSLFIARCRGGIASAEAARAFQAEWAEPKAGHNCLGWLAATSGQLCDDDGEPSGTAGKQIVGAIDGAGVRDVAVVVTRYRKGPRLGAGGLTRAYGAAARAALEAAPKAPVVARSQVTVDAPLARLGALQGVLASRARGEDAVVRAAPDEYNDGGRVKLRLQVAAAAAPALVTALENAAAGEARCTVDAP